MPQKKRDRMKQLHSSFWTITNLKHTQNVHKDRSYHNDVDTTISYGLLQKFLQIQRMIE